MVFLRFISAIFIINRYVFSKIIIKDMTISKDLFSSSNHWIRIKNINGFKADIHIESLPNSLFEKKIIID